MLVAFLWKAAAIINLVFGFIITLIATFVAYNVSGDLSGTGLVFIAGLIITGVVAALGALTCILEGFALSTLGFWRAFVAGSPSSVFSSGSIITAVIASIISTIIAVFIGGRVISTQTLGIGKKPPKAIFGGKDNRDNYRATQTEKITPIKVEVLPEKQPLTSEDVFPESALLLDRQYYLSSKSKIQNQLVKLEEETANGKISKATSDKIRKELEGELKLIEADFAEGLQAEIEEHKREASEIDTEIDKLNNRISVLKEEESKMLAENSELDARFKINQMSRGEFKAKQKTITQKLNQISFEVEDINMKNQELKERQIEVYQILADRQKETDSKQ